MSYFVACNKDNTLVISMQIFDCMKTNDESITCLLISDLDNYLISFNLFSDFQKYILMEDFASHLH